MNPRLVSHDLLWVVLSCLLLAEASIAQPPNAGPPQGDSRERMWTAPSAEDWKKPVLITWQRTFDDALQVSKETGKPILIAVNMDGEIASEHYAGIRYRSPEMAKLFEPYVPVIASVYRHTPRDHDENGRRIPCPRFGTVTCGEHIDIEPLLFDRYFEGQRVAPRHIMIELDGQENYDIYYAFDVASVLQTIEDGVKGRMVSPAPVVRGDRPLLDKVTSRDVNDRLAVESAYAEGDREVRSAILDAAAAAGEDAPVEVLRLAVFDVDLELARRARAALAKQTQGAAADLVADALRVPMEAGEREALVQALGRMGKTNDRAARMAVVYRGLSGNSERVDVTRWRGVVQDLAEAQEKGRDELTAELARIAEVKASTDPEAHLALAEAFLGRARAEVQEDGRPSREAAALYADAEASARRARELGASGWRVSTVLALTALQAGRAEEAHAEAEQAVKSMPERPDAPGTMLVLALFAEKRHGQIVKAVEAKRDWPGEWLADMHAAHTVLLAHPEGTESQAISHYDFLRWLDARAEAPRFLDSALARFPESAGLHERFRRTVLRDQGTKGLIATYERLTARPDAPASMTWYAAFASFQAAELTRRRGPSAEALEHYARAEGLFRAAIDKDANFRDNSEYYMVLIGGARARLAMEAGDAKAAVEHIVKAFELRPDFANARDGLNFSTVDTAKQLLTRLKDSGQEVLAKTVEEALAKLDAKQLELPEFERGGQQPGGTRPQRRNQR